MKKKFNFWLNIVTICFCVCAIAVGVYSATTASITASGKVGFVAHGCNVDVTGTIKGHSNSADGAPITTPESLGAKVEVRGDAKTMDIGDRYFSDMESTTGKPEDIVITLTVTNMSNFGVTATVDETATKKPSNAITVSFDQTTANMATKGDIAIFVITISMAPTNGSYAELKPTDDNFSIKIEFVRAKEELIKFDSTNNYYYITMGTNPFKNNEPLRWIPFAESTDGTTFARFSKTSEPQARNTYYFISELALRPAYSTATDVGIPYQGDYTYTSSSQAYVTGTQYQAQDYAVSNVRAFLRGEMAYSTCTYSNNVATPGEKSILMETLGFNILNSKVYKEYITARPLSELYEISDYMKTTYDCGDEADKLWLLSSTECSMLVFSLGAGRVGTCSTIDGGTTSATWWSRRIPHGNANAVVTAGIYGDSTSGMYTHLTHAVRPAFQITIPE